MGSFSLFHWMVVLVIVMLLFGAGRLSDLGKGLGEGIRNFKKGLKDEDEDPSKLAKIKAIDVEEEVAPKQLVVGKKKIIQVEVDENEDEAEALAKAAAAKKKEASV